MTYAKSSLLVIMLPLVTFYCYALDLYVPLVPIIGNFFEASAHEMQATNSYFMLSIAVGQLFFGPLSDRLGRRWVLFASLLIFLLGNVLAYATNVFSMFVLARVLQGLGSCGCYLSCFATVRDLFANDTEATEMFSFLNVATSTSAIIAPSIGTFLANRFGWRTIFLALWIAAMLTVLYCYFLYPSSHTTTKNHTQNSPSILRTYYTILTHPNYLLFTPPAAIGIASFFSLYSVSPYIYMNQFGFSKTLYSLCYGSFGVAFFIGSGLCSQLLKRIGIGGTLILGLVIHLVCVALVSLEAIWLHSLVWPVHALLIGMIFGAACMVSAGIGGTMQPFQSHAGAAFAMISCMKFLTSFVIAEIVVATFRMTFLSFGLTFLLLDACSLFILYNNLHHINPAIPIDQSALARKQDIIEDQIL